jgi:hypothetical protein
LIFNVRKSLTDAKPCDLSPYLYEVDIDLTTPVLFDNEEDRLRYGGTMPVPDKLHADVTIKVQLNDDTSLKSIAYTGLKDTDKIRTYTGVRDDPFVFLRSSKKNVISMVMSIPKSAFPQGQRDFILWGVTYVNRKVSDRVGRSVRSHAYVAIENIVTPWRPVVVFCFGLVHGMGFAGALAELNLPRSKIIPALISFNVGIELAQLFVITVAYFAVAFSVSDKW